MAKVTVQEPKSIVEEIERYECDECKAVVDEDGINTALLFTGDREDSIRGSSADETKHLCDDCNGLRHALNVREKREKIEERWSGFRGWFDFLVMAGVFLVGVGFSGGLLMGMGWVGIHFETPAVVWFVDGVFGAVAWAVFSLLLLVGLVIVLPEPQ